MNELEVSCMQPLCSIANQEKVNQLICLVIGCNNAEIETKEIRKELREYFINKGIISWQKIELRRILTIDIFALAP